MERGMRGKEKGSIFDEFVNVGFKVYEENQC